MKPRSVVVYCGAGIPRDPRLLTVARGFGERCALRGIRVVYGGARVGLMGALADGALAAGGEVVGVLPQVLVDREVAHTGLTELHLVNDLHERKALMLDRADACVALPGGIGTFDELFEAWTWRYLGIHRKPIGVLDAFGFYEHLVRFLEGVEGSGLLARSTFEMVVVRGEADELLDALGEVK
jgi:uncharacterized protein (TIGR00730 family)